MLKVAIMGTPTSRSRSTEQYSMSQSLKARQDASCSSGSSSEKRLRPWVGYSTSALTPSTAISLSRALGSEPPGWVWNPSPIFSSGKRGARSRMARGTRSTTVSAGSITWESDENSTSSVTAASSLWSLYVRR